MTLNRVKVVLTGLLVLGLIVALTSALPAVADVQEYRLDLEGAVHITELPVHLPLPNRVDIYLTGPRKYIDKADSPSTLSKKNPLCSITNKPEISKLISALQVNDNQARVANVLEHVGVTYHLLIFQSDTKTVMHFRVFKPTDLVTPWCLVDPRSDTGFCYFNDQIGSWFSSALTNAPPVAERQSNAKDDANIQTSAESCKGVRSIDTTSDGR